MAFTVPPLPYAYNALEPHIDEQTMEIHHDKHHAAYVTNGNNALEGTEWAETSVEEILTQPRPLPADKQGRCETTSVVTTTTRCSGSRWHRRRR